MTKRINILIPFLLIPIVVGLVKIGVNVSGIATIYDIIFTYLSIIIGFVITSITIIASSPYSKQLYKIQNPDDNSKTLLHSLLSRFIWMLVLYSIPMVMIILSSVVSWQSINPIAFSYFNAVLLVLTLLTFPILVWQFTIVLKFIIQSIKES